MAATPAHPPAPKPWRVVLFTALAYGGAGLLALLLAIRPSLASPLYPSAGIALAAVLVYGRAALPGVALGALLVNLYMLGPRDLPSQVLWLMPTVTALGAALQAALGAWLVRRTVTQPLVLADLGCVLRFFLYGGLLASLVNSSLSTSALLLVGLVPSDAGPVTWWTWWLGDTLGVLIGAPVALALVGRPRADWAPRRITLAVPLLLTTALLASGTLLVARWDAQRKHTIFERDAAMANAALQGRLRHGLDALQAMHGLFVASESVTASEFERASLPWVGQDPAIQALGFSQRLPRSDRAAFERQVLQEDGRTLQVFDRPLPAGAPPLPEREDMVVIRHIEPHAGNGAARGVNALSIPAARAAIDETLTTLQPAATAPFRLTQLPEDSSGTVIYLSLPGHLPAEGAKLSPQLPDGVVFLTLRTSQLVAVARAETAPYLQWCLWDADAQATQPRLAGEAGCEKASRADTLAQQQLISLGSRQWQLRLSAQASAVPSLSGGNAWLFATVGLASAGVLSALLLTVTGHTRRIEAAVEERTADLQLEMAARERTANALQASKQRLRSIFDHVPAGIVFADLDGRIRDANPRMGDLLGLPPEALTGRDVGLTVAPLDRVAMASDLASLVQGERPEVARQLRLVHSDGSTRWVQSNWSLLRGDDGQALGLVALLEDVTERLKRAEAEQGRQLAESANQAKNEFLSRMSHELRTPLNAMLGFTQLLELDSKPPLAPHQAAWAAQVLQAGWHLLDMINDTLDLSRIEAGMLRLQAEAVPLAPLVDQCSALVAQTAEERKVRLTLALSDDATSVVADPTRLKQVLTNLLSNAVKYNVQGGEVHVSSARTADGQVTLRVRDTGAGLEPQQLAQLFQPFNRLGREHGDIEGTGIGLVISRRLTELMAGQLHAESAPDQGATFVLTLPAASSEQATPAQTAPVQAPTAAGPQRHLLYIEDNETNVEVMRGMLQLRPQISLSSCRLGNEGLALAQNTAPDLILLDMHLPDADGISLLRALKADPRSAGIPVLAVSADATPARVAAALAGGAAQYLTKPLNLERFLAQLDRLLADPAAAQALSPQTASSPAAELAPESPDFRT